jgi:hypothetical protein
MAADIRRAGVAAPVAEEAGDRINRTGLQALAEHIKRGGFFHAHNLEWLPSHKGALAVDLQPQKKTFLLSGASHFTGVIPVPLCDPSQKGCFEDLPQAHQK